MIYFVIYKDANLKQPITEIRTDEPILTGQVYETTVFAQNISRFELSDILFTASDADISFEPRVIRHMNPNEVVEIKVIWKPILTRELPLNTTISADFRVIVRTT